MFESPTNEGKACCRCNVWQPYSEFHKCPRYKDGHRGYCRSCAKKSKEGYFKEYYAQNKERVLAANRARWEADQDKHRRLVKSWAARNPERVKEASRRWAQTNPDKVRARALRYYQRHPEKQNAWARQNPERWRAYLKEYNRRRPEVSKAAQMNRKHHLLGRGRFTSAEWKSLCESYGNRCLCCGRSGKMTVDHIIPVSKGGMNTIDNLQPLCMGCNIRKATKTLDYRPK